MVISLVISLLIALLSVFFLILARNLPHLSSVDPAGPALFPVAVACIAVFAVSLDLLIGIVKNNSFFKNAGAEFLSCFSDKHIATTLRLALVMVLSAIYPYFIIKIGFIAATAGYMFILMKIFKLPVLSSAAISILVAFLLNFTFVHLLQATVPEGEWLYSLGFLS
ncbi:tripartite tricarboxylate transporter TctB family protein [Desulfopila inferna]|uniref:tripartite tricarboxylate transporter TctB family protein n=1 Tax=Desulfopila inferna TaxID=468528 RepID=UPI001964CE33|nr:tripartite tricarboxylate transporter TctB family protein [Desulfopila inferna]MBM9606426.1 hypothetical protein [Desulfopila inferna]